MTFASDGTIWTIAFVSEGHNLEYHVLRRFDPSGRVLSTKTLQSRSQDLSDNASYLCSFRDGVGWLTLAGEYIEFALDGTEIARYDGPQGTVDQGFSVFKDVSMAITDSGDVIVANTSKAGDPQLFQLDRGTKTWIPVAIS